MAFFERLWLFWKSKKARQNLPFFLSEKLGSGKTLPELHIPHFHLRLKETQARNQLGTGGVGRRAFWEGHKFFKLCPIFSNYVQHIFPGGANKIFGGASPPGYGPGETHPASCFNLMTRVAVARLTPANAAISLYVLAVCSCKATIFVCFLGVTPISHSGYLRLFYGRAARFIFSKKAKPSVKKGQKRPTILLKKAKHSIKKGQKRPKPLTWQSQIY